MEGADRATAASPITGYKVTNDKNGRTCQTTGALSCKVTALHQRHGVQVPGRGDQRRRPVAGLRQRAPPIVPRTVPSAPRNVVVTMKPGGKAVVGWQAPTSTGGVPILRYTVVAAPGGKSCTTAARTCTVTGLTKGTKYSVLGHRDQRRWIRPGRQDRQVQGPLMLRLSVQRRRPPPGRGARGPARGGGGSPRWR